MSIYCNHGQTTGNDDGTSWEDAYKSYNSALTAWASGGNNLYVKEHAGITGANTLSFVNGTHENCGVYGGCDSDLTGTATSPRTGITVLDGQYTNTNRAISIQCEDVTLSRIKVYRYDGGSWNQGLYLNLPAYDDVATIEYCKFDHIQDNNETLGWPVQVTTGSPVFNDCEFTNNYSAAAGGAVRVSGSGSGPSFVDCLFQYNEASTNGGAIVVESGSVLSRRCKFLDNTALGGGGAMYILSGWSVHKVVNCLFADNTADDCGAVFCSDTDIEFVECTFMNNEALDGYIGGADIYGNVDNCIFWGNVGYSSPDIQLDNADVSYSDIQDKDSGGLGEDATEGSGCVDANPQVIGSGDDPYDLSGSSPTSVTNGGSTSVGGYEDEDINQTDRDDSTPSMGCYEYLAASDNEFTADGELPIPTGAAQFTQENAATAAGELPVPTGSAQFENVNTFTANAETPVPTGAASFTQENALVANGELPVPTSSASFEQSNELTSAGELPVPTGSAAFEQQNALTAAGELPVPVGAATFTQENSLTAAGELPVPTGSATFENIATNEIVCAGLIPVLEGAAVFENEAPNEFTAAGELPVPTGEASFDQSNSAVVSGELPVPTGSAQLENGNKFTASAETPVPTGSASFTQENVLNSQGALPVPEGVAEFYNLGENEFAGAGTLPVPIGSADFMNQQPVPPIKGCMTVACVVNSGMSVGPVCNSDMEVEP